MTWHYGIIRTVTRVKNKPSIYHYEIHEIYQGLEKRKNDLSWTDKTVQAHGESINEIRSALSTMLHDSFRFPIYEIKGKKLKKVGLDG